MFVLLFAFASNQDPYTITAAQFDQCDSNNKGVLELILKSENPVTVPIDFTLTLTGDKEIQAQCKMENIPTDKPIIPSSEGPMKPGSEGLSQIPETGKFVTDELKTNTEQVFDSTLENSDKAKSSDEETFDSSLENSDEAKPSDKKEDTFDSTLENSEKPKPFPTDEFNPEGTKEPKPLDSEKEEPSGLVPDSTKDDGDLSDQDALYSTDTIGKSRRLQAKAYEYSVTCTFEPPEKEGSYKLNKTDANIGISGDIALSLIPCLSQEQADARANIFLSFRQVNKFDKVNFKFWFYALTPKIIKDTTFSIKFYIYLLKGFTRAPQPVQVTCPIKNGANAEESTLGIYPVAFECSLPDGTSHDGYDSLEIDSSDDVAGFPTNPTFLNPVLTDKAIENGDVKDAAKSEIPTFVHIADDTLNFDLKKGAMEMKIPFTNKDLIKNKIHKTFEIPLAYPSGVKLLGKILRFLDKFLYIVFEIKGVIDNQPLIWEQNIITIGGDELFVMPGFKTEAITTDGYTENPEEEEEEKELTSDQGPEEGSDKLPEEGSDKLPEEGSDKIPEEGSDKIPEGGKSDKIPHEPEKEGLTNELISDLEPEGRSDKLPHEPEKEGQTDEIPIPPTIPEGAKERANMSLSFRQVNKFNKETFSFWFYALSSEVITDEKLTIIFFIYLIGEKGKSKDTVEATCAIKDGANPKDTKAALFPLSFECSLPKETALDGYTSIEIDSSDDVAGLPTNSTLLNPALMDIAIANGEFKDAANAAVPTMVEIEEGDLKFDLKKGTFPFTVPFSGEFDFEIVGKTFEIPLAYPSGVMLIGNILKFLNHILSIEFAINGKIENQPLIWEQTVISIEGVELFVMPGFETEPITTEGFNNTSSEEEEEPGEGKEGEEEPGEGKEGEEEPGEKGEEEPGEKGEEEPEKEGKGEEEPEKEGKGEEEPEKEGQTDEIEIPPTIPEGAKERANISLSFRQVNKFNKETFSFWFYALSSEVITDEKLTIIFLVYLIGEKGKSSDTIEATCVIKEGFNPEDTEADLFPVSFECSLPEGTPLEGYTSLEIDSSDDVAGLPTNSTLLNPALMDIAIANGEFKDAEDATVPTVVEIEEGNIKIDLKKGTFPFTVPFSGELDFDIVGKTFEMPLAYPIGVTLIGKILSFLDHIITIEFAINGKVDNQPLIWEQTVISIEGVELFVMPGYETEPITTEGFNHTSSEEEGPGEGEEEPEKGEKGEEEPGEGEKGQEEPEKEGQGKGEPEKEGQGKGEPEKEGQGEGEPEKEGQGKGEPEKEGASDKASSSDKTTSDQASADDTSTQEGTSEESESGQSSQTNSTEYEGISEEDAAAKAEIFISFRQLSGFVNSGTEITFNFYALTTQSLEAGNTVVLFVNLIGLSGMEEETTESQCTLSSAVTVTGQTAVQANYGCKIEGVNETEAYTSLRLNSSNDITGIPTEDDVALNPVLTDQAISNNEVKDCSKDSSVPPTFGEIEVDPSNCKAQGKFLIKGTLSEEKSIAAKFTLPLTYPEGTSLTCTYNTDGIECLVDKSIENQTIIVEQTIISNGPEELFILSNFSASDMECGNGLELQATEKTKVDISFRQVSHIEKISNRIYFFFAAFVNGQMEASKSINVNVIMNVGEEKVEKAANCILGEAVTASGSQGDFNCSIELGSEEQAIPLENLTISTNNDEIGGCAELTKEEASPKATDDAISNSGSAESELAVTVDYYVAENKNKKPPTLKLSSFDLARCESKGKIKVTGTLSEAITEEMTFELPFSYPSSKVKCTIEPSDAKEVEISCKIQKTKKNGLFNSFVIEPRLLKKKRKEMLFIESSTARYGSDMKCENFNEIKLKRAKARKNAPFSFLQLGRPSGYGFFFFMALMKKSASTSFVTTTFSITVTHSTSSRMRLLNGESDLEVECEVGDTTDNSGVLNCKDSSGITPLKIDLNDDTVGGIPDDAAVQTSPSPNLSDKANLLTVDNLPVVTVTNLTSNNCSSNGSYVITATSSKELDYTSKEKITVPFSSPDSEGLCAITVTDKTKLTMNCENTQTFSANELIISSQVIYDSDDKTPLFKIEDYTAPVQFGCAISDRSLKVAFPPNYTDPNGNTPEESDITPTSGGNARYFRSGSSSGLSGGAIAGIVISIVAVAAIVGVVIALAKKGALGGAAAAHSNAAIDNNSTINRFNINTQNANVV